MLWFDNSAVPLVTKIQKAVEFYQKRNSKTPDLCLVHPDMLDGIDLQEISIADQKIIVKAYRPILPDHLWICIGEKEDMKTYRSTLELSK